jgi:drug/metabolite transporter (DMT)-like permease
MKQTISLPGSFSDSQPAGAPAVAQVFWHGLLLMLGVLAGSTAVIMIKASDEFPILVASYRLLVAAVVLAPFFFREVRNSGIPYTWKQLGWSAVPALALAAHFITWVIGARMTAASNASLLVNMLPVALPFFLWIFYRERVTRVEILGSLIAVSGVFLLSGASIKVSIQTFLGDLTCLFSMLLFAIYLALGRKNAGRIGIMTYMVPLYTMAGLVCFVLALFFINPIKAYTTANLLYILGLGIIPTVFGHSILNYSMKFFRGQTVGLANLGQVIFAGIMGIVFFHEFPSPVYFAAAGLILSGILTVMLLSRKS